MKKIIFIVVSAILFFCSTGYSKSTNRPLLHRHFRYSYLHRLNLDMQISTNYIKEAKKHQKIANKCRRDALCHLNKAKTYYRRAARYARKGDKMRTETLRNYAKTAQNNYEIQMDNAEAEDKVAFDYLQKIQPILLKRKIY